jgi:hypothetical protein
MAVDQLKRKASQQREIDILLFQVNKRDSDLVAERFERGFFAHQPAVDRCDVKPRGIRALLPQLAELLRRE